LACGLYKSVNTALVARMRIECDAIVVGVRAHGEHGAIVRLMTPDHGLLAGYVRGGRSRQLRPVLSPGNVVKAELRARVETQLPALTVEMVRARTALLGEPLAAAAIEWTTALAAAALPEGQPYVRIHAALDGVLTAIESAPSARDWTAALVGYEEVVLAELGFGADHAAQGDAMSALRRNGVRLAQNILTERRARPLAARDRLVERLARALA
jgi:DNA repair protein RecO (recombination protein O)